MFKCNCPELFKNSIGMFNPVDTGKWWCLLFFHRISFSSASYPRYSFRWCSLIRYKSLTHVNGTLASYGRLLSGTSSTPTLLKYGIVRGKLTDNSTRTNAVAKSNNQTDFGLQLSWRGANIEETKEGPSTPYHYVAFQFSVSENVFNVELRDEQNLFQKCTAVLTLFLSVMGALRTMKCAGEKVLDTGIVLIARKWNKKIPEDVLRRQRILDEHLLTDKGARRLSVKSFGPVGKPEKARRMSSRELMQQRGLGGGPEIELTVMHDPEEELDCFVNPMKRKGGGTARLEERMDQLMRDIVELKKDNIGLKKNNVELKNDIVALKNDNVALKKDIVALKNDNVELKKKVAIVIAGQTTPTDEKHTQDSKQRTKRLSKVMKARRNSAQNVHVQVDETVAEDTVEKDKIHVDPASGRRYSVSAVTGESTWIDEGGDDDL